MGRTINQFSVEKKWALFKKLIFLWTTLLYTVLDGRAYQFVWAYTALFYFKRFSGIPGCVNINKWMLQVSAQFFLFQNSFHYFWYTKLHLASRVIRRYYSKKWELKNYNKTCSTREIFKNPFFIISRKKFECIFQNFNLSFHVSFNN